MDRRTLLAAIKEQRSPIRAWVHLTLEGKKNITTVYNRIQNTDTKIEDRGDEIIIYWRKDTHVQTRINLLKDLAVKDDRLE